MMNAAGATRCPYRGLVPFAEEDAGMFFGRDPEIRIVSANLLAARLTLLYGDSGVGKSSILRAGVVPQLRQSANAALRRLGRPKFHVVVVDRWQGDPMAAICDRLTERLRGSLLHGEPPRWQPGRFAEYLAEWTDALGGSLLFVFDQFEEYLRYHEREAGEGSFAEEFPRAVLRADLKVNFLLAVREDEYARLDRFKPKLPGLYSNYLRLRYLGPEAAREAILRPLEAPCPEHPAAAGPSRIEAALVDTILEDVQTGRVLPGDSGVGVPRTGSVEIQIQTPYLQLVLTRLWLAEAEAGSGVMRLATYRELGGADRIVRSHVDGVLDGFSPGEQGLAAVVFRHLVTPSGAKVAHSLTDLADYARCSPEALQVVLDRLGGSTRILRPVAPAREQPGVPRFEIYTDSLSRPVLDWGTRFRRAAERAEAEAKLAEERRRKLLFLRLSVGMAVAFLVAASLGTLAWLKWRESTVRELIIQANAGLRNDPEGSVALTLEAAQRMWLQPAALRRRTEQSLREALLQAHQRPAPDPVPADLVRTSDWAWISPDGALTLRRVADSKRALEFQRSDPPTRAPGAWERFDSGLNEDVLTVAFDRGGSNLAVGGSGGLVVWRMAEVGRGQPRVFLPHTNTIVRAAAFQPDGSLLATVGDDALTRLWDATRGVLVRAVPEHTDGVNDVAFSPDGRFLVTARSDHTALVRQVADFRQVAVLQGVLRPMNRVRFSAGGDLVWTAYGSNYVWCWASRAGQIIAQVGPPARIVAAAPTRDGLAVVSTTASGGRVWRQRGGTSLVEVASVTGPVTKAALSVDGRFAATAGRDHRIEVRDVQSPATPPVVLTTSNRVIALNFSADAERLASLDREGDALVWNWRAKTHGPVFRGSKAEDGDVLFSTSGDRLILASGNQPLVFAPTSDGRGATGSTNLLTAGYQHEDSVTHLAISKDGASVLSVDGGGMACVWSLSNGRPLWSVRLNRQASALLCGAFSPDARFIIAGGEEGVAHVWDGSEPGRSALAELPGHQLDTAGDVVAVWFSPDGRQAFTAGSDGTVRRHDTEELLPFDDLVGLARERLDLRR